MSTKKITADPEIEKERLNTLRTLLDACKSIFIIGGYRRNAARYCVVQLFKGQPPLVCDITNLIATALNIRLLNGGYLSVHSDKHEVISLLSIKLYNEHNKLSGYY